MAGFSVLHVGSCLEMYQVHTFLENVTRLGVIRGALKFQLAQLLYASSFLTGPVSLRTRSMIPAGYPDPGTNGELTKIFCFYGEA